MTLLLSDARSLHSSKTFSEVMPHHPSGHSHLTSCAAIPYAEPPVGDLRLRHPALKTSPGNGTFDASNFGPACLQVESFVIIIHFLYYYVKPHLGLFKNGVGISSNIQSEDCLTINVFRPSGLSNDASLPVLFWTYVFVHFLTHSGFMTHYQTRGCILFGIFVTHQWKCHCRA